MSFTTDFIKIQLTGDNLYCRYIVKYLSNFANVKKGFLQFSPKLNKTYSKTFKSSPSIILNFDILLSWLKKVSGLSELRLRILSSDDVRFTGNESLFLSNFYFNACICLLSFKNFRDRLENHSFGLEKTRLLG